MLVCVGVGRDMIGKWSEQNGAVMQLQQKGFLDSV